VAVSAHQDSFVLNTSTGDQSITGVGFTPKFVMFWGTRQTSTGYAAGIQFFQGVATGASEQWAHAAASDDAAANANAGRTLDTAACILGSSNGTPTADLVAALTTFDVDGFTINISNAPTGAYIVHYLALGGASFTAKAGTINSGTGSVAYTGIGFTVTGLMLAGSASGVHANFNFGWSSGASNEASMAYRERDAQAAADCVSSQYGDRTLDSVNSSNTASFRVAEVTAFGSDGFTLNWTTGGAAFAWPYVAFGGESVYVGIETQKTSTGTKATTGVGFEPAGILLFSTGRVNSASVIDGDSRFSFGGASAVGAEGSTWIRSVDAALTMDTDQRTVTDKIIGFADSGTTTVAEADLSSFDSDGFTLDWTTADGTAREFSYMAFGPASAGAAPTIRMLASTGVGT
jgi:hypothetical protein